MMTFRKKKNKEETEGKIKGKLGSLTPEQRKNLLSSAFALSRKYDYHKLMKAADTKGEALIEGREVHGYMQRMFPNYNWLMENDVFDYATDYALKYDEPAIFNFIKDYDFKNAIINVIHLPKEDTFDLFPNSEFNKVIILTHKKTFENSVYWIENCEWENEEGYITTKTLAPCNFLNMGFTLWNLPVLVLKDAVGMDNLFFEIKTTADQITEVREQLLKKHIYTKRQEEETIDEKLLEKDIRYNQLDERHQYLMDEIETGDPRTAVKKLRDFNKSNYKFDSNYGKKIVYGIIIIVILGLVIWLLTFLFIPPPTAPEIPETANLLLSNINKFNKS